MVHLNNDAVQKHGDNYGKFESANKMSLDEPRCCSQSNEDGKFLTPDL